MKTINDLKTHFYQWRYRRALKRLTMDTDHLKRELRKALADDLKDIIGMGK